MPYVRPFKVWYSWFSCKYNEVFRGDVFGWNCNYIARFGKVAALARVITITGAIMLMPEGFGLLVYFKVCGRFAAFSISVNVFLILQCLVTLWKGCHFSAFSIFIIFLCGQAIFFAQYSEDLICYICELLLFLNFCAGFPYCTVIMLGSMFTFHSVFIFRIRGIWFITCPLHS